MNHILPDLKSANGEFSEKMFIQFITLYGSFICNVILYYNISNIIVEVIIGALHHYNTENIWLLILIADTSFIEKNLRWFP